MPFPAGLDAEDDHDEPIHVSIKDGRTTMKKTVIVMGTGAQGGTIAMRLNQEPNVEKIICADYDLDAARRYEKMLAKAKIVDTSKLPDDEIHILSTAEVKNLKNGKTYKYTLVSEEEANLQAGKIAISSPVGNALMGAKKGDVVDANVPAGVIQFQILNIE